MCAWNDVMLFKYISIKSIDLKSYKLTIIDDIFLHDKQKKEKAYPNIW